MGDEQQQQPAQQEQAPQQAQQQQQAGAGNQVLSNQEREAARHTQQSGEQAARAAAGQQQQAPQQQQADPAKVQRAASAVHAELQRHRDDAPAGAAAGLSLPPELVDQLKSLSQQAIAFLIQLALQKMGSV